MTDYCIDQQTEQTPTKNELESEISKAIVEKRSFAWKCEQSETNPGYASKCDRAKQLVFDIQQEQNTGWDKPRIEYTSYEDTSCAHKQSGCEITVNDSFFGKVLNLKDRLIDKFTLY